MGIIDITKYSGGFGSVFADLEGQFEKVCYITFQDIAKRYITRGGGGQSWLGVT